MPRNANAKNSVVPAARVSRVRFLFVCGRFLVFYASLPHSYARLFEQSPLSKGLILGLLGMYEELQPARKCGGPKSNEKSRRRTWVSGTPIYAKIPETSTHIYMLPGHFRPAEA